MNHKIWECHVYKSPKDKYSRAKQLKLCFNCLRNTHTIKDCPSKAMRCKHCNGQHHSLLCRFQKEKHVAQNLSQLDPQSNDFSHQFQDANNFQSSGFVPQYQGSGHNNFQGSANSQFMGVVGSNPQSASDQISYSVPPMATHSAQTGSVAMNQGSVPKYSAQSYPSTASHSAQHRSVASICLKSRCSE